MIQRALGEVCDILMGQAPPGSSYNTDGHGLPLVAGAGDFGPNTPAPTKYTTEPTQIAEPDDIILCIRATIGDLNWADRRLCLGRGVAGLRPNPNHLDRGYLWHWFEVGRRALAKEGRGSTFKQVSREAISKLQLRLPPLAEQRRIAAILDKADAIRRKRREAVALTEQLLQSAFAHTVGMLNPQRHSWPETALASLAASREGSIRSGPFGSDLKHSEFVDDGIVVLGIDNAVQNRFAWGERRFITVSKYQDLKRYKVYPGDVIVTIMGTTGRSAVVPADIPEAITTKHLATITLDPSKALPDYVSHALHRDDHILRQISLRNRGAIMEGLNLGLIKELQVRLPPIHVQECWAARVASIETLRGRLSVACQQADNLFNSLVQRAFRGEL